MQHEQVGSSTEEEAPPAAERTALWRAWPGRNRFCCGGRLMRGPVADDCPLYTGWFAVLSTGVVFGGIIAPSVWGDFSGATLLVVLGLLQYAAIFYNYFRACFTDPGIVPRGHVRAALGAAFDERRRKLEQQDAAGDLYHYPSLPLNDDVARRCPTCRVERPPLSSHCNQCDNCTLSWDHHCNWIGTCVGQRNHRYFINFVVGANVFCGYAAAMGVVYLTREGALRDFWAVVVMFFVMAMACVGCMLLGVTSVHLDLVCRGQTMKMRARFPPPEELRAGGCGLRLRNCASFFCRYSPRTSLLPLQALVPPDTASADGSGIVIGGSGGGGGGGAVQGKRRQQRARSAARQQRGESPSRRSGVGEADPAEAHPRSAASASGSEDDDDDASLVAVHASV